MKRIPRISIAVLGLMFLATVATAAQPDDKNGEKPNETPKQVIITEKQAAPEPMTKPAEAPAEAPAEKPAYWLGIECRPVPPIVQTQLALPAGEGIFVASVMPGSPADKAKILRHDILVKANSKKMNSVPALIEVVAASEGKPISLEVIRAGKQLKLEVTPGERPVVIRDLKEDENGSAVGPKGNWLDHFGGFRGGLGPRFRVLHPGVILPGDAKTGFELAEDTSVTIVRRGNEPAKIKVQFEGQTYETTEDDLDKLPENIRGTVESMLGGPFRPGGGNVLTIGPHMKAPVNIPSQEDLRKEMDQIIDKMNRDMEQLRRRMQELTPPGQVR